MIIEWRKERVYMWLCFAFQPFRMWCPCVFSSSWLDCRWMGRFSGVFISAVHMKRQPRIGGGWKGGGGGGRAGGCEEEGWWWYRVESSLAESSLAESSLVDSSSREEAGEREGRTTRALDDDEGDDVELPTMPEDIRLDSCVWWCDAVWDPPEVTVDVAFISECCVSLCLLRSTFRFSWKKQWSQNHDKEEKRIYIKKEKDHVMLDVISIEWKRTKRNYLESSAADITSKRLESGVFSTVSDQVGGLTKCFSTDSALVRFFACKYPEKRTVEEKECYS